MAWPPKAARPRPARRPPLHPLEALNSYGEWRNPYSELVMEMRGLLERTPHDYDASVAYIRSKRPSIPARALQFWNTTPARVHTMIALLGRGERTIARLHHDLGIGHDKIYTYLPRWNVEWRRRPDDAVAQDPNGERALVIVERWHGDVSATVRLAGYAVRARARWLPDAWEFRLDQALTHRSLVPLPVAAQLLNLTPITAGEILPVTALTAHRKPLVAISHVEQILPPSEWTLTLQGVRHDLNHCRCAYFDINTGGCSLQPERALPERGTAPHLCEDYLDDAQ